MSKNYLIIGGSSGIGEALAEAFAKLDARLILSSRREAELERVKAKLKMSDDNCLVLPLSYTAGRAIQYKNKDTSLQHLARHCCCRR